MASADRIAKESRGSYDLPGDLEGKVVKNLDELRNLIPSNNLFGEIHPTTDDTHMGYHLIEFSRKERASPAMQPGKNVAYKCFECDSIIIGMPRIEVEGGFFAMLMGEQKVNYYCTRCDKKIYEK